jgi:hypothetical protein
VLARFPELTTTPEVDAWLAGLERTWVGRISTRATTGAAGSRCTGAPGRCRRPSEERSRALDGVLLAPLDTAAAEAIEELGSARLDGPARRCLAVLLGRDDPPPARLRLARDVEGERLRLDVLWDHDAGAAFDRLPGADDVAHALPLDPWVVEPLDAFLALHRVAVEASARPVLERLRAEHTRPPPRCGGRGPRPPSPGADRRGPGRRAGALPVGRRALRARREARLPGRRAGAGQDGRGAGRARGDGAFPAIVVCPASLKLTWEREARRWLRTAASRSSRAASPCRLPPEITILNYEIVAAHREALGRRRPRALVVDESHLGQEPAGQAHAGRAPAGRDGAPDGLRLALTGTPVLNHAEELVSQLRVLGRLQDFGSGARFRREFRGQLSEERLHWHLRRRCFVRRLKSEVSRSFPPSARSSCRSALDNERDYRLAEDDVIAWLREQPLDLSALRRASRPRCAPSAWPSSPRSSGWQRAASCTPRWPGSTTSWPRASRWSSSRATSRCRRRCSSASRRRCTSSAATPRRPATPRCARSRIPDGPQLLVAATRVAGQGLTLTRASNVAFLELEWTPGDARPGRGPLPPHRPARRRDRLVPAGAGTIDETMARLIQRKRGIVAAVTDGRRDDGDGLVEAVVRELREGRPFRHLRPVA